MRLMSRAVAWPPAVRTTVIVVLMIVTICLDALTGPQGSMLFGYTVTVALAAWLLSGVTAIGAAVALSVATGWLVATDPSDTTPLHNVWLNATYRAGSLALTAVVVATLRNHLIATDDALGTDPLTGARSRRAILGDLDRMVHTAVVHQRPLSVVYFDLDDLKVVNDEHGHVAGDALICALVDHIRAQIRERDRLGRLGGDEFLLVCPDTDPVGAHNLADRIMSTPGGPSASWGVADTTVTADPGELIRLADDRMYAQKLIHRGRHELGPPTDD